MIIKEGYNSKPLTIRINEAEVWIEMENPTAKSETLSYATINELIELRDECNRAIRDLAGL